LFVAWISFYTDFPAKCRLVTEKEKELIERGKNEAQLELNDDIPYWVSFSVLLNLSAYNCNLNDAEKQYLRKM
jgi:hypothetical protein